MKFLNGIFKGLFMLVLKMILYTSATLVIAHFVLKRLEKAGVVESVIVESKVR